MNTIIPSLNLKDLFCNQVKLRIPHEYVVPSNFATNSIQKRIMKNAHHHRYQQHRRLSLPPSIREENEDDDVENTSPPTIAAVIIVEDDEDIPLAILAYRKGFVVPDTVKNVYPLVQHNPSRSSNYYYRYSDPCLTLSSPSYMFNNHPATNNSYNNTLNNTTTHCHSKDVLFLTIL